MSDFLFSSAPRAPGELGGILRRWLGPVAAEVAEHAGAWGTLAVLRSPVDAEPTREEGDGLSVLVGEPLARVPRAALDRALLAREASGWEDRIDGPFAALVVDRGTGQGMVATDLFAWIPLFEAPAAGGAGLVVGTHVDAVAEAAGVRDELDPVSAVEMMGYFTISHPRTLYPGVVQAAPGSTRRFGPRGWEEPARSYWEPAERVPYASLTEAAEVLRAAFVDDVARAVEGRGEAGVLLSGGEDSRAVLGAVPPGVAVRAFVYAERAGREFRSARRVARAYGAELRFERRPPGHDLRHFDPVAAMVGTQNQFVDVHNYGLHASMGIDRMPVVLGGFSSDALLKADNVGRAARARLARGADPGIDLAAPPPLPGVRPELLREAASRRDAFRRRLAEIRPASAEEWSHVYPFTMRKYAGVFHGDRRLFRSHEPFMSSAVVRVAAGVPQRWKLSRRLFHAAFRPLLAPSWYVPHTRNRLPYFPHAVNVAARPLLGLARDLRALATGEVGANQESWPIWEELVRTPEMEARARAHPLEESPLAGVFADPGAAGGAVGGWSALNRLAALQLAALTGR